MDNRYNNEKSRQAANKRIAQSYIKSVGPTKAIHESLTVIPNKQKSAAHIALQMEIVRLLNRQADEAADVGNLELAKVKLAQS